MNKNRRGVYRICLGIWILFGLVWFAAVIAAVQEIMEKNSKKLTDTDEKDPTAHFNGYQETHMQNKPEPNDTKDLKEVYHLSTPVRYQLVFHLNFVPSYTSLFHPLPAVSTFVVT